MIFSQNYKFGIVQFINDEGAPLGLVPMSWLSENNEKCFWPSLMSDKNRNKAVQCCSSNFRSWDSFAIILKAQAGELIYSTQHIYFIQILFALLYSDLLF